MRKKISFILALMATLAVLLAACGDSTASTSGGSAATTSGAATTASGAVATTSAAKTTAAANTTAAAANTTAASGSGSATTAAASTTAASGAASPAAAGGAGVQIDVSGSKVTVQPGGGQKFQPKSLVTIKFWHSQSKANGVALKSLVDEFMAKNPNIKVEVDNGNDTYTYNVINDKVTQAATTGQLPNVVTGYENWVPAFVEAKVALPLNQFISGQYGLNQQQLEDYYPQFIGRGIFPQYNNETYGWVFANSSPVLYYNKDILDKYGLKVPETWDDFVTASKTIYEKSNKEIAGFVYTYADPASPYVAMDYSRGSTVYDYAAKKFTFSDKPSTEVTTMLFDGAKNGYFLLTDPNVQFQGQVFFEQQKAAFYMDSTSSRSYIASDLAKGANNSTKFNWNAAMIPHSANVKPVTTLYGGMALGFKGKSQDEDLATWEFMKFLGSADFQAKWGALSGYIPATKSAFESAEYKAFLEKSPENKIPLVVLQYATATEPKIGQWQAIRKLLNDNFSALFQNPSADIAANQKKLEDDANKIIK